ncbi:hypothetical protein AC791_15350 [Klebsiella sp. RIT-PI-d]|uniref:hypothetical protein n=1 Tax=Klebsiella sp. RIT-PI-d TaxID=1681196 RepID=UPI000676773A|nr:hypothetical protein [Klebsiella sp. RIT-PI-d]KNC09986.1 hypothetical protein AC791_15350 [Klebsiella sp. RIT-PI-d]
MYREDEKLTDIILGEAVIKILDSDAQVSFESLLTELESMMMAERNIVRKKAILSAINLVKANLKKFESATPGRINTGREILFFSRYIPMNIPER